MGDMRYNGALRRVTESNDRAATIAALPTPALIEALAASSRASDPYLANVIATALLNRERRVREESLRAASLGALLSALASLALATLALFVPASADAPAFAALASLIGLLLVLCVARIALLLRGKPLAAWFRA